MPLNTFYHFALIFCFMVFFFFYQGRTEVFIFIVLIYTWGEFASVSSFTNGVRGGNASKKATEDQDSSL